MKSLLGISFLFIITFNLLMSGQWQRTTGPTGGNVTCLTHNEGILYAGLSGGGVFYSTDSGLSWQDISYTLPVRTVRSILAIPRFETIDSTILIVGVYFNGMFRSSDNGRNWHRILFLDNNNVLTLAFFDGKIFAGTLDGIIASEDLGHSWNPYDKGMPWPTISNLLISGTSLLAVAEDQMVFRLDAGTDSWVRSDSGLNSMIFSLASYNHHVAVLTHDGLFFSEDTGRQWRKLLGISVFAYHYSTMAMDNNFIYIGTDRNEIMRISLRSLNYDYSAMDKIIYRPISSLLMVDTILYSGVLEDGIYRSTDHGVHWQKSNNGLIGTSVYAIDASDAMVFCGMSMSYVTSYNRKANIWQEIAPKDARYGNVKSIRIDDTSLFIIGDGTGLMRWSLPYTTMDFLGLENSGINTFTENDSFYFIGTAGNGIYRKSKLVQDIWTLTPLGSEGGGITRLYVSGTDLIAGSLSGKVYVSTDNGRHWNQRTIPGLTKSITAVAIIDTTLFVGTQASGVFRSTDRGGTWWPKNKGNVYFDISDMVVLHQMLFLGTSYGGVFRSSDRGEQWIPMNEGLPYKQILSIAATNQYLYASTSGTGVWEYHIHDIVNIQSRYDVDQPNDFWINQNYPNPFNATTSITYSVPVTGKVTLSVYNILGIKKAKLVDQTMIRGRHSITFEGNSLPSGVYFYTLKCNGRSSTKKMLLLK
ncbi:MAG: T9SS type A sorting domain-containing protein [Bacteroidota bacterium]